MDAFVLDSRWIDAFAHRPDRPARLGLRALHRVARGPKEQPRHGPRRRGDRAAWAVVASSAGVRVARGWRWRRPRSDSRVRVGSVEGQRRPSNGTSTWPRSSSGPGSSATAPRSTRAGGRSSTPGRTSASTSTPNSPWCMTVHHPCARPRSTGHASAEQLGLLCLVFLLGQQPFATQRRELTKSVSHRRRCKRRRRRR